MFYKINTQFMKYSTIDSISSLLEDLESQNSEITTLDLSLNTFTPQVFLKICQKIKNLKNCKQIIFESILDSLNYDEMCEIMTYMSEYLPLDLECLELPSNALSCNFPSKFGSYISSSNLKILNLHNCGLGEDGLKKIAAYLSNITDKSNLVSLDLSKNRINVICQEFADILSQFRNLSRIILNANTIEETSMAHFLKNLKNQKLEILNLTDNFVCGKAIDSLGDLFIRNDLKELYLQDIKVDEGDINKLLKKFLLKNSISKVNIEQPADNSNENIKDFAQEPSLDNKSNTESNSKLSESSDNKNESVLRNSLHLGLPGSFEEPKPSLTLDLSCNNFDQECIELLNELTELFVFEKLIIFDNNYEDCEKLKQIVVSNCGRFIDEEEDDDFEPVDESIIEMIKQL